MIRTLPNGEAVLLHIGSEVYFGLNPVGVRIWDLLTQGHDVSGIVDRLDDEFDVGRDVLRSDVQRLIGELLDAGLVGFEAS